MATGTSSISPIHHAAKRHESVWQAIIEEASEASKSQPVMASFFHSNILNHHSFQEAITFYLSNRLSSDTLTGMTLHGIFSEAIEDQPEILDQMLGDLLAHYTRDAACDQYIIPLLYYKGFHAIQSYRIAHWLWQQDRRVLAMYFQHRISELFDVDIHPAATLGSGIMLDHATGLVIGETAVVGDDVSILHAVTLGGSGSDSCQRHPKVGRGVLLSAGAKLLGNITIGDGVKVGAGSLVLNDVPPHTTVAGVPAKQVGKAHTDMPSLAMDHRLDD
jgi:serine O-acetyltransferase